MDIISSYSRAEAIADGVLIDAMTGVFESVSRQHYKYPVAMTAGVFVLIEQAVNDKKYHNDFAGIWHDILSMAKQGRDIANGTGKEIVVYIQRFNANPFHAQNKETLHILCGPGDNAEPVLTVMLPNED